MQKYWFFNSAPGDERKYQAQDFANYFGLVLTSGILAVNNQMGLQVESDGTGMQVYVEPGKAIIKGNAYENTTNEYLTVDLPEPTEDRIDRIVLRHDLTNANRHIKLFVKRGTASAPPTLQRDQFIYEISLARVTLEANTSSINPVNIVDERMEETLAGVVSSLITVPTSQFQEAWNEWFNSNVPVYEQEWQNWYETNLPAYEQEWQDFINTLTGQSPVMSVNGQTPDATGNVTVEVDTTTIEAEINDLSEQIGVLSDLDTTDKTSLVNAINELFTFANDGKAKWSSVIGSPLVSGDTFTQMQNKTQTIKNTLATNLTAKGQSSTGTETLTALAGKVANITQNPFASYSITSKAGNTTGLVGINSDGETYTNSSGTVSRRNYGGTVLETFPSKGGVVWFSEDKWCGRPSTNMPVIYDSNNTIIHTTTDGSYGSDQSSFSLNYLSFNGEYAFSFPTSLNQRIYYKSKSGSTTSLTWPWFPVMYPICVYNKSTQSGAIIGLGSDQYSEIREMFYQRGNTISSTTMRGLDLFLFVPFKV